MNFSDYLQKNGIQRQFTCRYTPQQNGVVERKNMHIVEIARALMSERNLPHYYWIEAIQTVVYIMNKTPTMVVHGAYAKGEVYWQKTKICHI